MIIDISFGWRQEDSTEDGDSVESTLIQDQGDCDITRPNPILQPLVNRSSSFEDEMRIDAFDNGYWRKLPRE